MNALSELSAQESSPTSCAAHCCHRAESLNNKERAEDRMLRLALKRSVAESHIQKEEVKVCTKKG